jgi:hypothetical protein
MANFNIDYLIIAGGGGGASASSGYAGGGAGGAGGYRTSYGTGNISGGNSPVESALNLTIGTPYTITVGDGGAGGPAASPINAAPPPGVKGDDSVFASITSEGGGYGVGQSQGTGGSGGSAGGGGGGSSPGSGGTGTSSQGSNGGTGTSNCASNACYLGGGGGGASQAGSSVQGGKGGDGLSSSITGSSVIRAGGGSGGSYGPIGWNDPIAGGAGGGGDAGVLANGLVGQPGTTNTGGGGGGATWYTNQNSKKGGDGGSGIVILRYATADANYTTTGSTPTEDTTTIPGQTILSFTTVGTGSITFTTPPPPPFSGTKVTTPVTDFNKPNTEEGLKIPSGASSEQPTGVTGMVRNDTNQSSKGSASAITYYNGTDWRYFENELNTSFNTVIYTGSTSPHTVTGVGFAPDLIWIKRRNIAAANYYIVDTVRGNGNNTYKNLASDTTSAEGTTTSSGITNSTIVDGGFTMQGTGARTNANGSDYVAWCFKAGGLINKSADFNGSSSYVTLPSNPIYGTGDYSVSVWAKCDNLSAGNSGQQYITQFGSIASSGGGSVIAKWANSSGSANKIYIHVGGGYVLTSHVVVKGAWTHYTVTQTGTSILFYVNGSLHDTLTAPSSPNRTSGNSSIGYYNNGSHSYFGGNIQQVRVFNSVLTSSDVTELYNETAADNNVLNYPTSAGCIAAYPLGENANDLSNTYNGTASNVTFGKPGYLTRNTEGTIESTVSANNDLGFSIVEFNSGTNSSYTLGHGLDAKPEMIISKVTNVTASWPVFHKDFSDPDQSYMYLDGQASVVDYGSSLWNYSNWGTDKIGATNVMFGSNNTVINYCFTSKPNYSKVGSYLGNGSTTGPVIDLGFEPAWLMFKCATQAPGNWIIIDNKRATSNPRTPHLRANSSAQDDTGANEYVDFTSNGFQPKGVSNYNNNSNNQTYIYLAFANTI